MEEVGEGKTGGGLGRTTWNSGWSAKYEYVKRIPLSGKNQESRDRDAFKRHPNAMDFVKW